MHSYEQACSALKVARELDLPVVLLSAPGAASYAGAGWFRALIDEAIAQYPGTLMSSIPVCASASGDALAALREGVKVIRFDGKEEVNNKIACIAKQLGASVINRRPSSLDLMEVEANDTDIAIACREWLQPTS